MKYPTRYLVTIGGVEVFSSTSWLVAHAYSGHKKHSKVEKTNRKEIK